MNKRRNLKKILILTLLTLSFNKIKTPIACLPEKKILECNKNLNFDAVLKISKRIFKNNDTKLENTKKLEKEKKSVLNFNNYGNNVFSRNNNLKQQVTNVNNTITNFKNNRKNVELNPTPINQLNSNLKNEKLEKEKKSVLNFNNYGNSIFSRNNNLKQQVTNVNDTNTNFKNNRKNEKDLLKIVEKNLNPNEINLTNKTINHLKEKETKNTSSNINIAPNVTYVLEDTENKNSVKFFTPNEEYYVKYLGKIRDNKNLQPNFNFINKDNIKNTNIKYFTSEEKNVFNNIDKHSSKILIKIIIKKNQEKY